jgi:hypothetical protein
MAIRAESWVDFLAAILFVVIAAGMIAYELTRWPRNAYERYKRGRTRAGVGTHSCR